MAIKVEDGAGTSTLTVLGVVNPGTNTLAGGTNVAVISVLRVDGDMAFGAGSTLRIDISGTNGVAGVDFDRLVVDHDLTGLANAEGIRFPAVDLHRLGLTLQRMDANQRKSRSEHEGTTGNGRGLVKLRRRT